jgi:hypothetical protein
VELRIGPSRAEPAPLPVGKGWPTPGRRYNALPITSRHQ